MGKTVWIVNEYNIPCFAGARQNILSKLLVKHGYNVYILCGSFDIKSRENLINDNEKVKRVIFDGSEFYMFKTPDYHNSYGRVYSSLSFQHMIWKNRNKLPKPDVIVSDFAGLFGNIFLKWKKKYNTRIVFDILDLWPEGFVELGYIKKNSLLAKFLYHLEHKSYRCADGLIFSMKGGRDYIIDKGWSKEYGGDVETTRIGYLNNGIDLKMVDSLKDKYVLNDPDLDSDKFKVVYLGSISDTNGLDVLVDAAKCLYDNNVDNIIILVYGHGNQEKRLREMVNNYGIDNIIFKGKLDREYGMNLLSRCDLNIFTFKDSNLWRYGVSPNKLFMYFASGKPVLSMIKPNYDLVEEKKAGISVENDAKVVADAIVNFSLMDEERYNTYCANSRKTALEYDYSKLVSVLIDHIEE